MKASPQFSLGISEIDRLQKKVFDSLLALENSLVKKDPWHIVRFLIAQLADSLHICTTVEETLADIVQYPRLSEHRDDHLRIKNALATLDTSLRDTHSASELLVFFDRWYANHVLTHDRLFASHVIERIGKQV